MQNKIDLTNIIIEEAKKFSSPINSEGLQLLIFNVIARFNEQLIPIISANANVCIRTYNIDGSSKEENMGQEVNIDIEEPHMTYIAVDQDSIKNILTKISII